MKRPAISTRLLRVLAVVFAISMLTLYVAVKTLSAGKEQQRTRASSTKAQNISSVYRAAKAAAAKDRPRDGGTPEAALPADDFLRQPDARHPEPPAPNLQTTDSPPHRP
jgi:hypothetical protein